MIKRLLLILIAIALPGLLASAQYVLHDCAGAVKMERAGKALVVQKGMEVTRSDIFTIPDGGWVEILDKSNSQIYKSQKAGRHATTRIMLDARAQASNTGKAIHDNLRFGTRSSKGSQTVYVEKGMVTRSMEVYDPEAINMQVDPDKLCEHVAAAIRNRNFPEAYRFPVKLTHSRTDNDGGMRFAVENTMPFPLYFNVLKIKAANGSVEISELGQPSGNYVLLSNQAISREQFAGMEPGCMHVMIMTHCYFDIDELVDRLDSMLRLEKLSEPDAGLPVYLQVL